jgi:hypothetical protein
LKIRVLLSEFADSVWNTTLCKAWQNDLECACGCGCRDCFTRHDEILSIMVSLPANCVRCLHYVALLSHGRWQVGWIDVLFRIF